MQLSESVSDSCVLCALSLSFGISFAHSQLVPFLFLVRSSHWRVVCVERGQQLRGVPYGDTNREICNLITHESVFGT
jgi:hypothetical protein